MLGLTDDTISISKKGRLLVVSADMVGWEILRRTFVCCRRYSGLQATSIRANLTLAGGDGVVCMGLIHVGPS